MRKSEDPWEKYLVSNEIELGTIKEAYPDEKLVLIKEAFVGFGECAKALNPDCMVQYAMMILASEQSFPNNGDESPKKVALYWLNLAARYGNDAGRKLLVSLGEEIPNPDLALESHQKQATIHAARANKL